MNAKEFVKEAEDALKTSFFKWNPDYLAAGMYFEKAAKIYKPQDERLAVDLFRKASMCHQKAGVLTGYSKSMEEALILEFNELSKMKEEDVCKKINNINEVIKILLEEGKLSESITFTSKISKSLIDNINSISDDKIKLLIQNRLNKLLQENMTRLKKLSKVSFHLSFFDMALQFYLTCNLLKEAGIVLSTAVEIYSKINLHGKVHQCRLAQIALALCRGDSVSASDTFTQSMNDTDFMRSSECEAAELLIRACAEQDQELLDNVLHKPVVSSSLNQAMQRLMRTSNLIKVTDTVGDETEDLSFLC